MLQREVNGQSPWVLQAQETAIRKEASTGLAKSSGESDHTARWPQSCVYGSSRSEDGIFSAPGPAPLVISSTDLYCFSARVNKQIAHHREPN